MTSTTLETSKIIELTSNGKLLISGEYFVLDGAKAFALPCKFGQKFRIEYKDASYKSEKKLHWQAYTKNNVLWLDAVIDLSTFTLNNDNSKEAMMLLKIIKI